MQLHRLTDAWLRLFVAAFCLISICAAADHPKISHKEFDYRPSYISYFDDSDVVLTVVKDAGLIHRSTDGGVSWRVVEDIDKPDVVTIYMHPTDKKMAIAMGTARRHWITKDRGESWKSFETELDPIYPQPISFHSADSDKIIINTVDGEKSSSPQTEAIYTTNAFKSQKPLRAGAIKCSWAKEKPLFETGKDDTDDNRVLCVVFGKTSPRLEYNRLLISDNYFEDEYQPDLEDGRPVEGIVSLASATRYILAARRAEGSEEMAMYVTKDTNDWHRAIFEGKKLQADGYTIMESTNYSVQVDVVADTGNRFAGAVMGQLFSSNSNGTYFTRNEVYTNRNSQGYADFEKLANIQGVALVNIVANAEEVLSHGAQKDIVSQITFDDGRTFKYLKAGDDNLHLHSVTDMSNSGRVFSSPAPGLVMGIGNTGKKLLSYEDGDLYVSDTGGEKWYLGLKGAHKYEFGDQGAILVAVYDEAPTDRIMYSFNHGKDWSLAQIDEEEFKPIQLTTVSDSTSKKFLLQAVKGRGEKVQNVLYSIDFDAFDKRECKKSDFEKWYARYNETTDEPLCIMGHTQMFHRRKADADCFVDNDFDEELPENDNDDCHCTDEDFECDYNFIRSEDRKSCIPSAALQPPKDACRDDEEEYEGPSGWRLIPGNTCKTKGGVDKTETVKRKCKEASKPKPIDGKIAVEPTDFSRKADGFREYFYLERSQSKDETVLMTTSDRTLYISQDHGKDWQTPEKHGIKDEVVAIYPNRYAHDHVYFITNSEKIWYSKDRGEDLHSFEAPGLPSPSESVLKFHETNTKWLIFIGGPKGKKEQNAYYSTNGGEEWHVLLKGAEFCEFMHRKDRSEREKLVFCVAHENENMRGPRQLISSEDWFEHSEIVYKDMIRFATMSDFIIVAKKDDEDGEFLNLETSVDGTHFADAKFPPDFKVDHQTAYTVLDSSTGSIFVHVTVNSHFEQEYGTILKSNSNGTYYVRSVDFVNRNEAGYVDFEKMLGLEGVSMVNQVANADEVNSGSTKKLKTLMSHNDGADWRPIDPPSKDYDGKSYDCSSKDRNECSLNLHGYTERADYRDTLSSPSAIGIMMGVGNVGKYLSPKKDGDTFISNDGGVTWRAAMKGQYMWEFGDRGSIIVIVSESEPTNKIFYTRDEGVEWFEFEFTDDKVDVRDITTMPGDGSLNFLLWTHNKGKPMTFNIDFSPSVGDLCKYSPEDPDGSDYHLWTPRHPTQDNECLFGHVAKYWRKNLQSDCYNGPALPAGSYERIVENCTCTTVDYEW